MYQTHHPGQRHVHMQLSRLFLSERGYSALLQFLRAPKTPEIFAVLTIPLLHNLLKSLHSYHITVL